MTPEQIRTLFQRLVAATQDEEPGKRFAALTDTANKMKEKKKTTGWPALANIVGADTVGQFKEALGLNVTVAQLAEHKRLPLAFLENLGLRDTPAGITIPYRAATGKVILKERTALRASDGSRWPAGEPLLAYGDDRELGNELVLVEGESDCWVLRFHDISALGLPGAGTVRQTLHERHVAEVETIYLLEEPDAGGKQFRANVTARLAELGWTGTLKVVRLDPHKDPADLHVHSPEEFKDAWQKALEAAETVALVSPMVDDLGGRPPWPEPLAAEAFHGLAGDVVRLIEPASEADPAALLLQFLVLFGNAAGRNAYFSVEDARHYPNEFLVLVGQTAKGRKGTSWGRILPLFQHADAAWADQRVASGLSSGEGVIWAVRDPVEKSEKVREHGQTHYVKMTVDHGVEDKRLLVNEAEFPNVLRMIERQGNSLSTVLRLAWDTGKLTTMVKNNPACATGAHISVVGHGTVEEVTRYLSVTEAANGFANRFLWACVGRSKFLPDGGRIDPDQVKAVQEHLAKALAWAKIERELQRDAEARDIWHQVYRDLSDGKPGLSGAILGRAEAHVLRLSMQYALLDFSPAIKAEHLLAALAVWEYVEASVRHIFGNRLGDPLADEILALLRASPGGLTRSQLQDHFSRNRSAEQISRALALLAEHRLAVQETVQTGGRPAEVWKAVRT
jgi:hypothetical protein